MAATYQTQHQSGAGKSVDQPTGGNQLHPVANLGGALPHNEQSKIPVLKRTQTVRQFHGLEANLTFSKWRLGVVATATL